MYDNTKFNFEFGLKSALLACHRTFISAPHAQSALFLETLLCPFRGGGGGGAGGNTMEKILLQNSQMLFLYQNVNNCWHLTFMSRAG